MNLEKKIGLITYDHPHQKTQEILWRLKVNGYTHVTIFALPFVVRKRRNLPLYNHRPSYPHQLDLDSIAKNLSYNIKKVVVEELFDEFQKSQFNKILIAGAGLLPETLVNSFDLINSHPAILPHVRGLDAFKWAITDLKPIGVTVHLVNKEADAGLLIKQKELKVYNNDNWFDVALRLYYLEMDMLVDAVALEYNKEDLHILPSVGIAHKRMLPSVEKQLMSKFDLYKNKFGLKA